MRSQWLFDDDNAKERGVGCDAICNKNPQLIFKWKWTITRGRYAKSRKLVKYVVNGNHIFQRRRIIVHVPCQTSHAKLKNGWTLKALFWHTMYEARVSKNGEHISSYMLEPDEATKKDLALLTRLDAQLMAEKLFEELGRDIIKQVEAAK